MAEWEMGKRVKRRFPEPIKCECETCGNRWVHNYNHINAIVPHEARPLACPKCGSIEIKVEKL